MRKPKEFYDLKYFSYPKGKLNYTAIIFVVICVTQIIMDFETKLLVNSDGSCRMTYEGCQVLASVSGPSPNVTYTQSSSHMSYLRVFVKQAVGSPDSVFEKSLEALLKKIINLSVDLERYPRTKLNVSLLLVSMSHSNKNALKACAINSAVVALIDAGFPLKCLPLALADHDTLCVLSERQFDKDSKCILYLDTMKEEEELKSFLSKIKSVRSLLEIRLKELYC